MGMAERVDGDTSGEVQVSPAIRRDEISTIATLESDFYPAVGRHHRRHWTLLIPDGSTRIVGAPEKKAGSIVTR